MQDSTTNTTRIAKNTLHLYFRMMITMLVRLYTSRVVLNALEGRELSNIQCGVGGVVVNFSILSALHREPSFDY